MMKEECCIDTFFRSTRGADIAVIEGVMWIYDGIDGSDFASTAHVARILDTPVILVVDVKGMSRSVLALIKGYQDFDTTISFAGVILNRVGSPRPVSYTHLRAHETDSYLVCRLLLEKK